MLSCDYADLKHFKSLLRPALLLRCLSELPCQEWEAAWFRGVSSSSVALNAVCHSFWAATCRYFWAAFYSSFHQADLCQSWRLRDAWSMISLHGCAQARETLNREWSHHSSLNLLVYLAQRVNCFRCLIKRNLLRLVQPFNYSSVFS